MRWTILTEIPTKAFYRGKLRKDIDAVNDEIRVLSVKRQSIVDEVSRICEQDVAEVDYDGLIGFPSVKVLIVEALQDELRLRKRIAALLDDLHQPNVEACDKANAAHQELQNDVRARLVSIGYVDASPSTGTIGTILPGYIAQHPEVHAATLKLRDAHRHLHDRNYHQANDAAIKLVTNRLKTLRLQSVQA